jgi:hypothetical protein
MNDIYRTLIPVLWAIVSAAIGLILYKSSSAFFERRDTKEGGVRRIRLVGSVVIAALVFIGLRQSTPTELMLGRPAGSAVVLVRDIQSTKQFLEEANSATNDLLGCATVSPASQCIGQIEAVRSKLNSAKNNLAGLVQN